MNRDLLEKMADVINSKSKEFYAVVPRRQFKYMNVEAGHLMPTSCYVLSIVRMKQKRGKNREIWNIYEFDIWKKVKEQSRKDRLFRDRMLNCEPTPMDVEIIVKRASFRALNLKISPIATD